MRPLGATQSAAPASVRSVRRPAGRRYVVRIRRWRRTRQRSCRRTGEAGGSGRVSTCSGAAVKPRAEDEKTCLAAHSLATHTGSGFHVTAIPWEPQRIRRGGARLARRGALSSPQADGRRHLRCRSAGRSALESLFAVRSRGGVAVARRASVPIRTKRRRVVQQLPRRLRPGPPA